MVDPFLGILAVMLGFSETKKPRKVKKKTLEEIVDEHFIEDKKTKKK